LVSWALQRRGTTKKIAASAGSTGSPCAAGTASSSPTRVWRSAAGWRFSPKESALGSPPSKISVYFNLREKIVKPYLRVPGRAERSAAASAKQKVAGAGSTGSPCAAGTASSSTTRAWRSVTEWRSSLKESALGSPLSKISAYFNLRKKSVKPLPRAPGRAGRRAAASAKPPKLGPLNPVRVAMPWRKFADTHGPR